MNIIKCFSLVTVFISSINLYSQSYFDSNINYNYFVEYKDSTIHTKEKMTLHPLGKRWVFQPWKQVAFKYIFYTDTAQLRNYLDPEQFYRERDQKYLKKKGKARVKNFEVTGGVDSKGEFFLHPPRVNQYRALSTAIYPNINKLALDENISKSYGSFLQTYGKGGKTYDMTYITTPLKNYIFNNQDIGTCWEIKAVSLVDGKENSSFTSCYSPKFGFLYIYYQLENGTKINFNLNEVEKL